MHFTRKRPCSNCPFRKVGGIRVSSSSAESLANQETVMQCHKTVDYSSDEEPCGREPDAEACVGFLAFRDKRGDWPHNLRLAVGLGLTDGSSARDPKNHEVVVDLVDEIADSFGGGR